MVKCALSKFYRRNRSFLPKNIVTMKAKGGQLKGTGYKRNMKVLYRLFCRRFARTCSPNVPSPFEDGNASRFQLHL